MVPSCKIAPVCTGFIGTASMPAARKEISTAAAATVLPASVSVPVMKKPLIVSSIISTLKPDEPGLPNTSP
jgi:hypothetical protein